MRGINCFKLMTVFLALKYSLPQLRDCHVLVRHSGSLSHNHQGGLCSRNLNRIAGHIFLWAQEMFLSLRAVYISGHLNMGADLLSRQKLLRGGWKLRPEVVKQIWIRSGGGPLRLLSESAMFPLLISESPSPWVWMRWRTHGLECACMRFPPVSLLPGVLARVWFSEIISLLNGSPWTIPERRDLVSQTERTVFHPRPNLWNLHVWPLMGTN